MNRNRPALDELLTFAETTLALSASERGRGPRPALEGLMAAYDFRPLETAPAPSMAMSLKALRYAGWRRQPAYDPRLFVLDAIDDICARYRKKTGHAILPGEMEVILNSFHHYLRLKDGVIGKWKLLKKN